MLSHGLFPIKPTWEGYLVWAIPHVWMVLNHSDYYDFMILNQSFFSWGSTGDHNLQLFITDWVDVHNTCVLRNVCNVAFYFFWFSSVLKRLLCFCFGQYLPSENEAEWTRDGMIKWIWKHINNEIKLERNGFALLRSLCEKFFGSMMQVHKWRRRWWMDIKLEFVQVGHR